VGTAGLLVGQEGDDEVAGRPLTGADQLADGGEDHGVHVLHVDGAAAPHAAVADLRREGVDLPVVRARGDDVEVTVDEERRPRGVGARDARDDVGPARLRLDDVGLEADLGEQPGDVLGGLPLPRTGPVAEVRRVDPDELAADVDDFRLRAAGHGLCAGPAQLGHGHPSTSSAGCPASLPAGCDGAAVGAEAAPTTRPPAC
jgi:hypothetical protein